MACEKISLKTGQVEIVCLPSPGHFFFVLLIAWTLNSFWLTRKKQLGKFTILPPNEDTKDDIPQLNICFWRRQSCTYHGCWRRRKHYCRSSWGKLQANCGRSGKGSPHDQTVICLVVPEWNSNRMHPQSFADCEVITHGYLGASVQFQKITLPYFQRGRSHIYIQRWYCFPRCNLVIF